MNLTCGVRFHSLSVNAANVNVNISVSGKICIDVRIYVNAEIFVLTVSTCLLVTVNKHVKVIG